MRDNPTAPVTDSALALQEGQGLNFTLLGDSTVAKLGAGRGIYGWGECLGDLFPRAGVANLASSGASTKSFLKLPQYAQALETPATHWLIQFGHNDMKDYDPDRYTTPEDTYRANLLTMATAARSLGATPVLVTSPHRILFDPAGAPTQELLPYVSAVRTLAADEGIALIDLYEMSGKLLAAFGKEESQWITATHRQDYAHFTAFGARVMASFVGSRLLGIIDAGAGVAASDSAAAGIPSGYQRAEDGNA